MLHYLATQDVGPAAHMALELAPRINLLTGDNGLGKTFVLDIAWWALTGTWPGRQQAQPRPGRKPRITLQRAWDEGRRERRFDYRAQEWDPDGSEDRFGPYERDGIVLYVHVDGRFSAWDSARNTVEHLASGFSETMPYEFSTGTLWDGYSMDGRTLCNGLIRDWVTWQDRKNDAFGTLRSVLETLSPVGDAEKLRPGPPTSVSVRDARDIPTLEFPYETVPIIFASAGMRRILSFAYLLVWTWYEHKKAAELRDQDPARRLVLLIDELEAHLHPQWQRILLPALLRVTDHLAPEIEIQILASTHSPMVLASAEPGFDEERDALFSFDLTENEVELSKLDWHPRGDASAWLTSEVFDLAEPRSLPAERAIKRAHEAMMDPDISNQQIRQLQDELEGVLPSVDPFWPSWLAMSLAKEEEP